MSDEKKGNFLSKINIFKKVKLSKNVSVAIAIVLSLVALLIFFSSFGTSEQTDTTEQEYTSMIEYTDSIESKLKTLIMSVDGVEKAEVMITFESSVELIISSTKETKTVSSGSSETVVVVETPVLVTEKGVTKPIVLQEKLPKPSSVFIVAKGAENPKVKLEIIKAVEVLFSLPSSKIEVLAGK